jgi:hypothetical protein
MKPSQSDLARLVVLIKQAAASTKPPSWWAATLKIAEEAVGCALEGKWERALSLAAAVKAREARSQAQTRFKTPALFAAFCATVEEVHRNSVAPSQKSQTSESTPVPRGREKRSVPLTDAQRLHLRGLMDKLGNAGAASRLNLSIPMLYGMVRGEQDILPETLATMLALDPAKLAKVPRAQRGARALPPQEELADLIRSIVREELALKFPTSS